MGITELCAEYVPLIDVSPYVCMCVFCESACTATCKQ